FQVAPEETGGRLIYEVGGGQWDIPALRRLLETIVPYQTSFHDFEVQQRFERIGERVMVLNGRRIERKDGKPGLILLGIEDITERFMVRRRLEESEGRYRKLVEEINSIIIGIDQNGTITFFNRFSEKLFGYAREEVVGKSFVGTIIPAVDFDGMDNGGLIARILTNPMEFYSAESEGMRSDGGRIWFSWSAHITNKKPGRTIEVLIDGNDITERKEARIALRRHAEALYAANRDLEAFSYSVSHDLRNPLTTISTLTGLLHDDYAECLDTEGRQILGHIKASTAKMRRLIDSLLCLSRAGRQRIEREDVLLSVIVRDFLRDLKNSNPDRRVEYAIQENVHAHADRGLITIALENLLRNAWKFTATRKSTRIEFGSVDRGGTRAFYVRDNGVGFNPRHADELFEPFRRAHDQREFAGSGIGLSIVQRIITKHGGTVWAEGAEGKGATFFFTLGER
ncbi:MAG: PAS domain S-box protein, partial [Chitinivibrionales bacterium]|nr:PAS domain S-box protein [Chitinivibrionales bacterium]MBD3356419.1 PAS domain S-box protein [Chitinivibrionales bacterium]